MSRSTLLSSNHIKERNLLFGSNILPTMLKKRFRYNSGDRIHKNIFAISDKVGHFTLFSTMINLS